MKPFKKLSPLGKWSPVLAMLLLSSSQVFAESSYDIAELYTVIKPESGTKAVGKYDKTMDVEYILTPTKADTGKFVVDVQKIGDNLYRIKNTDLCVETRYCYEYTSFSEEVVLVIESNFGYTKGKIIFD